MVAGLESPAVGLEPLDGLGENREAVLRLLSGARYEVCIFTRDLEPLVYGRPELVEAFRGFLLSGPRASLRLLVRDSASAMQVNHPLIELLRRLTDRAEVRRVPREYRNRADAFLVVDRGALLHRPLASSYDGVVGRHAGHSRDFQTLFNAIWEQAEPDPELRRLHL